jgi:UDP-glucuronate decarboxylase
MKRVLVTGATGFIGQHTIPVLESMGYEVVQCSRKDDCDLLRNDHIRRKIERDQPTHLLHLAWDVSKGYKLNASSNMQWTNQSMRLVHAFVNQGGKRLVVAGTQRIPEINNTPYGWWKHELNRLAAMHCRDEGVSYAYGRIHYLFGEGEKKDRLVPYMLTELMNDRTPILTDKAIDIMYVKDVAAALCYILDSDIKGDVDIGLGKATAIRTLEQMAKMILDKTHLNPEPLPTEGYAADIRALKRCGWTQRYSLFEGLERTIHELYQRIGWKVEHEHWQKKPWDYCLYSCARKK